MELKFRRNEAYQFLREEMTPEGVFMDRRRILTAAGFLGAGSILGALPAYAEEQQKPVATAASRSACSIRAEPIRKPLAKWLSSRTSA